MLEQADDFLAESETLAELLETMKPEDWEKPTQFKGWTTNDVVVHLHFWNKAADLASTDESAFMAQLNELFPKLQESGLRAIENDSISERGTCVDEGLARLLSRHGGPLARLRPQAAAEMGGGRTCRRAPRSARGRWRPGATPMRCST